jgi:myosin heavy subunit
MVARNRKPLRAPILGIAGSLLLGLAAPGTAQVAQPIQEAQFDPSDAYFQGWQSVRKAEELENAGDFIGAMEKLRQASKLFLTVRKYYPNWKDEMVRTRAEKTEETITRVKPKAEAQMLKNRSAMAELEGGVKKNGEFIDPSKDVVPLTPGILEVNPLETRRLRDAEAEVERLRGLAANGDIKRQNEFLNAQLNAAQRNVESLRARLAAAPVEKEMKSLNDRISSLEQEREAMAMALTQSRGAQTEALAKIATLEADLKVAQQKYADVDRDLKTERKVSSSVVAAQRNQLNALEKQLEKKNGEIAQARQEIEGLKNELKQSHEAFAQLKNERDNLMQERDQMSALLKLDNGGRIQDLIEQNMALAKNLREANEKVERLNRESNADKDAITDAIRDLAIAKQQINALHQEKREQDKRVAELEAQLKNEESSLAAGKSTADPAEVETLRDIIRRQLRVQERRRQARDLLIEAAKQLGSKDEKLTEAVKLFDAQEIALTPEEQKLIDARNVDGEFFSPTIKDRATVNQATSNLNRNIAVFERTAEKSYMMGRLLPTRELYEMILEQSPNHPPTLCRVGVVNLKLNDMNAAVDAFRRAAEMDSNNPFAYQMLGYSYMLLGDMPAAEQASKRSVDLSPNNYKSQMIYATICFRVGRYNEAESHFKAAITADPIPGESYRNLALLYLRLNRRDEAREFYQKSLERGAVPDPALEEKIYANPREDR